MRQKYILFAAFALSGFSGLIYESVWTNYLKFFLGHAAYAQALVLAMFMGGMAVGACLSSRYIGRIANPLIAYAIVEVLIGLFGLTFHELYVAASNLLFGTLLPGVDSAPVVELVRWGMAAALIVVQTLLLGATFPLMSVGILRAFPGTPGGSISMLYFTNSIGAVVGVLLSGFVLIEAIGLPGTVVTAGMVNMLLAVTVYAIGKGTVQSKAAQPEAGAPLPLLRPMLLVAMVTGLSSFIYEIAWIRMLSMITGASTHAFELMLSAFILGLALGGLWLRKRIDRFGNPLVALGVIQLLMGGLALSTVLLYNPSLQVMSQLFSALKPTVPGYLLFNTSSHLMAMALMLPTTFMAGMTLPLITLVLYRDGGGESAVGKVYAMNTLGAIAGIVIAAMLLLPQFGLKAALVIGAALDLLLALFLFSRGGLRKPRQLAAFATVVAMVLVACISPPFDAARMASSIFRGTSGMDPGKHTVLLHKDGRTATVDVTLNEAGVLSIITNGKPDASINVKGGRATADEPTMVLLGALPQLLMKDARQAAMIGMGAGMSADVLLMSPQLEQLDIVEIEAGMVEGARMFGDKSARAFSDPRSRIHIDDAKSYFASHKKRYDVIVSEPSDTWVSGVATLFTDEFYGRMRRHLNKDGLLVQWVATYASSPEIFASIMKAVGKNFADYRLYATTDDVVVIIATADGKVPELDPNGFGNPALAQAMRHSGMASINDVHLRELGRKDFLAPLFETNGAPMNSDYFPYVDQHAARARFLGAGFNDMTSMFEPGVPVPGKNFMGEFPAAPGGHGNAYGHHRDMLLGRALAARFAGATGTEAGVDSGLVFSMEAVLRSKPDCQDRQAQLAWLLSVVRAARAVIPAVSPAQAAPMLAHLRGMLCDSAMGKANGAVLDLMDAVAARDMVATEKAALKLVSRQPATADSVAGYAYNALLLSYYQQKKWRQAALLVQGIPGPRSTLSDLVFAHAIDKL